MRKLYAHVGRGGAIDAGPTDLPDAWGNVAGLRGLSDKQLAAYGWFPVVGRGEHYSYMPCQGAVVAHDDALFQKRAASIAMLDQAAFMAFQRTLTFEVVGEPLAYPRLHLSLFHALVSAAVGSGMYVPVVDQHGQHRMRFHTAEQCAELARLTTEMMDDIRVLAAVAQEQIREATSAEEVQAIARRAQAHIQTLVAEA